MIDFLKQEEATGDRDRHYERFLVMGNEKTIKVPSGSLVIIANLNRKNNEYNKTKSGKKLSLASSYGFDNIEGSTISLSLNVTADLPK